MECLKIDDSSGGRLREGDIENIRWLEFFSPFSSVKGVVVPSDILVSLISSALAELADSVTRSNEAQH